MVGRDNLVREDFMKVRKKYWLETLIIKIIPLGALIVFTQGSVITPFFILSSEKNVKLACQKNFKSYRY